ncbi:unnamed protein product [Paramecium sonneborni]|uniref:Uncharacterized protein n=1 Tax=Paramecium sonneborni TaxID=65129 RepID=A0A8S1RR79_9CILI|nr:unnamed protein product [Paramecium sonneborni]
MAMNYLQKVFIQNKIILGIYDKNHFDWHDPKRNDLMYLSTIRNQNKLRSISQDYKYTTNLQKKTYYNKETFINKVDDIPIKNNKFEAVRESLYIDDIAGTRPQIAKFKTTRETNPVEPIYKIPSYQGADVHQPNKFIRDTLNISDIQGTVPKIKIYNPRNVDPYTFIEGSKPKQLRHIINPQEEQDMKRASNRQVNPLQPFYKWGEEIIGPVEGSQPFNHCKDRNKLKTQSDTVKKIPKESQKLTNNTQDIYRAQADTIQRGMQTKRQTNPLQPAYQLLGQSELYNMQFK